ncbi:hypothetical protein BKA81DRAFT_363698 [Phyllosticta paracitricarpa]|uniref:Uncharacterized protein n=2 Tax=Phyllosticta TaxID=121621 RepID=A0ABR1LWA5_9PEZI
MQKLRDQKIRTCLSSVQTEHCTFCGSLASQRGKREKFSPIYYSSLSTTNHHFRAKTTRPVNKKGRWSLCQELVRTCAGNPYPHAPHLHAPYPHAVARRQLCYVRRAPLLLLLIMPKRRWWAPCGRRERSMCCRRHDIPDRTAERRLPYSFTMAYITFWFGAHRRDIPTLQSVGGSASTQADQTRSTSLVYTLHNTPHTISTCPCALSPVSAHLAHLSHLSHLPSASLLARAGTQEPTHPTQPSLARRHTYLCIHRASHSLMLHPLLSSPLLALLY